MFKKNQIKLQGVIDTSVQPTEIRVKPTSGDIWEDFGYWLEATNFIAYQAMAEKRMSKDYMIEYITSYLHKSLDDINLEK